MLRLHPTLQSLLEPREMSLVQKVYLVWIMIATRCLQLVNCNHTVRSIASLSS